MVNSDVFPKPARPVEAQASDVEQMKWEQLQLSRLRSAAKRYGVALLAVLLALAARYLFSPVLGEELPFMFFIAASLVAAWYGGATAGVVALLLGLFAADYFFVGPVHGIDLKGHEGLIRVVRYLFTASLGIALIELLHRSRRSTEKALAAARAESRLREKSEKALVVAHELLQEHARRLDRRVEERTAALAANVRSLEEILYNIAHSLRAPIRASASFSQLFLDSYGTQVDPAARDYIQKVRRAAVRMDALTRDLLEYGQLAHQLVPVESINLEAPVQLAIRQVSPDYEEAGAKITIRGQLFEVKGHGFILQTLVVELLENALRFRKPEVPLTVRIWAQQTPDKVRLWVEDNGIGIESKYHNLVFGVFEQLRPAQSSEGTGIGLALVKQGIHRQGGQAGLESEPGKGSRFWLELPRADV